MYGDQRIRLSGYLFKYSVLLTSPCFPFDPNELVYGKLRIHIDSVLKVSGRIFKKIVYSILTNCLELLKLLSNYFDAPLSTLHPTIDGALQSPAVWFTASNIPCRVPFKVLFFHGKEKNSAGVRRLLYGGWSSVVTPIFTSNSETINMVRFGTLPWFKIKVLNIFFRTR